LNCFDKGETIKKSILYLKINHHENAKHILDFFNDGGLEITLAKKDDNRE